MRIHRAAEVLLRGGVIAYPTEGVFGLGCLPDDESALLRLLGIKHRDANKGLILLAAERKQLCGWVQDDDLQRIPDPDATQPITWIVAPGPRVGPLVQGEHDGVAVRLTTNPTAAAICRAADSPLTSTSANLSGRPVVRNRFQLQRQFGRLVDCIAPGDCGPSSGPSEIRVLATGLVLRASEESGSE